MDDVKELVRKAQGGDESAFGDLVMMHHEKVYAVLMNIVHNNEDARDLAQQTWIKVWKKLDSFKGDSAFFTWVYRVATFTALDFLRARKRKAEVAYVDEMEAEPMDASSPDAPDEEFRRREIRRKFDEGLKALPDKHRSALVLRELDGLSYKEIAAIMGCRIGTVMSRIFNARKSMQAVMKDVL